MRRMKSATETLLHAQFNRLRERYGVQHMWLFGSVARGEDEPGSDVDIVVEFARPSFDDFMNLKFDLESQLQRPVDLVTRSAIRPRMRLYIESEAIAIA